jgi:ABC-2 type transport system permease protein
MMICSRHLIGEKSPSLKIIRLKNKYNGDVTVERVINPDFCKELGELSNEDLKLDRNRTSFILKKKFRKISGRKRLGLIWMILDPIVISLVYLFVFTVLRASTKVESVFIGITLFRLMQVSLKTGMKSIQDFSGGLKAERVRTRVLINALLKYRIIDNFLQSFGVALILLIGYNVSFLGILAFLFIAQIIGFLSEGLGMNLAPIVKNIPDISNLVNYILMVLFFASPALYPMSFTTGIHYKLNELNPFTYFVETSRFFADLDSVILELDLRIYGLFLLILGILTFRGYFLIDKLRWRMTTWS